MSTPQSQPRKPQAPDAANAPLFAPLDPPAASPAPIDIVPATCSVPFETNEHFFFGFCRQTPSGRTPSADDVAEYRYDAKYDPATREFVRGRPLFLIGPTGSGKSTYAKWLGFETGLPYLEIPHDAQFEIEDVLGTRVQDEAGRWVFQDGPLVELYTKGGIYNADELPSIKPSIAQAYHPFIASKHIHVRTKGMDVMVPRSPNFRFIATGNPWGSYAGNYEPGFALTNRMLMVQFDYITKDLEIDRLCAAAPNVAPGVITDLVDFANAWRAAASANPDTYRWTASTRMLIDLVEMMEFSGASLDEAVHYNIVTPVRIQFPDEYGQIAAVLNGKVALDTQLA